jgi:hypothetical protein
MEDNEHKSDENYAKPKLEFIIKKKGTRYELTLNISLPFGQKS